MLGGPHKAGISGDLVVKSVIDKEDYGTVPVAP